jgi:mono/diheme cytochrome c family protein
LIVVKIIAAIMLSCFAIVSAHAVDPKTNWSNNCMQCHGPDGSASTAMGKALNAKDLTNAAIQSSFTDAEAAAAIKGGVTKDGMIRMIPFGGKLTEDEIKALVTYVRTLKK